MPDDVVLPPHDLAAEQSVLGAMMINPAAVPVAVDLLSADDFYRRTTHGRIFQAVCEMYADGTEIDQVTVASALRRAGALEEVGGAELLQTLVEVAPTAANVREYAEAVRDASLRRGLVKVGTAIAELGYGGTDKAEHLVDAAEQQVLALAESGRQDGPVDAVDALRALKESLPERRAGRHVRRVRTGFETIDNFTGGLGRGEFGLLGARPSIGKTALATCVARNIAFTEGPVLFLTAEMSCEALTERLAQAHCAIGGDQLRTGALSEAQERAMDDLMERLAGGLLRFKDASGADSLRLRHVARMQHAKAPLALVIVDYLQLLRSGSRAENRQQEVAEISHQLKALASELDCAVLALSQLNRQVEDRSIGGKPRLSDLRDSGALEQDADLVIFLHMNDDQRKTALNGATKVDVELEIAKNRNGRLGTGTLVFDRHCTRFRDKLP